MEKPHVWLMSAILDSDDGVQFLALHFQLPRLSPISSCRNSVCLGVLFHGCCRLAMGTNRVIGDADLAYLGNISSDTM